ncbi:proline dehydrogenase family protein [Streptomyces sp. NPDC060011]|uniref:proline dehydrogenase family protein n=1 Tax=unclassified Streptomyces TaxID=2593676 RepID=UPI0013B7B5D7|nr:MULTISPECIES: proline dehydrogenase family protein [unclassified Streptomyces]NEB33190.1 proline dehydrogenase [Streptomyces sp. SID14446]MCX5130667.1 proline dehydrogenase family protein [Streptomyces sp. NBC_00340]MCX5279309.1 proline dehydrogenase family protein [Streptomyces sp. NBC_00198]WSD77392.1 proline dehydrogenase family protein [Streptomyces sp. NBC_01558]WSK60989.1 proline dehydrogenase family protein [Streptomyces sp. NBC_01281]
MLGPVILAASRSDKMRRLISAAPVTKPVVDRFIPGETVDQVVPIIKDLTAKGLELTMDVVGEDITTPEQAAAARDAYLALVDHLKELDLGTRAEMSVKLSMFGQALEGGHELALANVRPVVEAAAAIGTTVTLDAEDHTTLDSMFAIHEELRKDFPQTGCVIQAYLFRTEADARRLAESGSRVRVVKGAYKEPAEVAYQQKAETDKAYVRILKILMEGEGYPMIGSHDPRIISIAQELARKAGRKLDEYEFQMLYGIRSDEHLRLAAEGHRMRVYTAYGTDWYGYFMRRLAEKPANLLFFARSILTKG